MITCKDNYRPIALTSVCSKILEIILLGRVECNLYTSHNQFGFKNRHSTDMCVYSLKETINFYISNASPVYVCFLDASKAFDRINHWLLFDKLLKRNVNAVVVKLLLYWYRNQEFCVRWGNTLSLSFSAINGVRQGGII